jgi:hypothetical protein
MEKTKENIGSAFNFYILGSYYKYRLGKDLMSESELKEIEDHLISKWDELESPWKEYVKINKESEPFSLDIDYHPNIKLFAINFGDAIKNMIDKMRDGFGEGEEREQNMGRIKKDLGDIVGVLTSALNSALKRGTIK